MKKISKKILVFAVASVFLSSCLKDTPTTDYSDSSIKPVVIIPNGNFPANAEAPILTFETSSVPSEIRLYARVSWSKPLGKSIEVTFENSTAVIDEFNTKWGTHYVQLNSDAYSLPSTKVTIAADQNEAYIPITLYTDKVSLTQANMLAFKITDASGETIGSNFQKVVFPIGVKNKYDGVYSARIKATGWAAYGIQDGTTFSVPGKGLGVVTAGSNSVTLVSYANGNTTNLPAFTDVGGFTSFGATTPKFTFDLTTNKLINVVNTTPDDGRGRTLKMNPAVTDSRYDPTAKKMYLSFIMTQNGRPDQIFYDTLTYTGAR